MRIICTKKRSYAWHEYEGSFFRGYIQLDDGTVLRGIDAIKFFLDATDYEEYVQKVSSVHGIFSMVLVRDRQAWITVDIARSMPLYYSIDGSIISDDAEIIRAEKQIDTEAADPVRLLEMYESFYTAYDNTVYDEIKQLSAGTSVRITKESIEIRYYYKHYHPIVEIHRVQAMDELKILTDRMISRMKDVVGDRTIVLSLSGGHDSRYLACSLKENGIDNVICFSYGKNGSDEIRMSSIIAKALNYEWHEIEYTNEKIEDLLGDEAARFLQYSGDNNSIAYVQNYIAIRELKKRMLIPEDSVFITGLCNDMPTGQYIPKEEDLESYSMDIQGAIDYVFDHRFFRFPVNKEIEKRFKKEIENSFTAKSIAVSDYQSFIQAIDSEITDYEHTRNFMKMNEAHDYFGYQWLLPCWDKELLEFWYKLPVHMRQGQSLYNEYIKDKLTNKYGIPFDIVVASYGSNKYLVSIKRIIGSLMIKCLYPLGIPLRRKADINNFASLEIELYKRIKNKKMVNMQYAGMRYLLAVFELEQRFGIDWFKRIRDYRK